MNRRRVPHVLPRALPLLAAPALAYLAACGSEPDGPRTPADSAAAMAQVDTGFVQSGQARLFYRAVGEGPPVVVIHGGPALEHSYLLPGLKPLAKSFRLIFYDQRASGHSPAPLDSTSITLEKFVADVDSIRTGLGYERVNLLGHSWGGVLAILYASRQPDRVRSVTLMSSIEPGSRYQAETQRRQRARQSSSDSAAIRTMVSSGAFESRDPTVVNQIYRTSFKASFADEDSADALPVNFTERTARAAGTLPRLLLGPIAPYDFWNRLDDMSAPTLVVHGREDLIPTDMAREMARMIPDAELVLLDDVGHFPFVEAPDTLYGTVRRFLNRHGG